MKSDLDKFKELVGYINEMIFGSNTISKPKRKRGRPKGSKNRGKISKARLSAQIKEALKHIKRNKKQGKYNNLSK